MSFFGSNNPNNTQQQPTFGAFGQPQQPQQPQQQQGSLFGQPNAGTGQQQQQPQFGGFGATLPFGGFGQQQPQQQQQQPPQQQQSMFGQQPATMNQPTTSAFGGFGGSAAPTTGQFGSFGGFGNAAPNATQPTAGFGQSLFGQPSAAAAAPASQQQPAFGQQPTTTGLFGASAPKLTGFGQPSSSFGGFGGAAPQPTGFAPSTFGQPAPAGQPSSAFAQPSSTFAQQPAFGQPAPAAPATTTATSSMPTFSFGQPAATTAPAQPAAPTTTSLFGQPPKAAGQPAPATGFTGFNQSSLFGGQTAAAPTTTAATSVPSISFGAQQTTTQPAPTGSMFSASTAPPSTTPSLFGSTTGTGTTTATAPSTSEPPKPSFSFSVPSAQPQTTTEAKPSFSFGSAPTAAATQQPTTQQQQQQQQQQQPPTTTKEVKDGQPVTFPSALKGKTLEEIVVGWQEELQEQVNTFHRCAIELSKWDRDILANEEAILSLSDRTTQMESWEAELEQNLAFIAAQQAELESLLEMIEKELPAVTEAVAPNVMPGGTMTRLSPADAERDRLFTLAESLQSQLNDLSANLTDMIADCNQSRPPSSDLRADQVNSIMNEQLETLIWIDRQLDDLKRTKAYTKRLSEKAQVEHERLLFR